MFKKKYSLSSEIFFCQQSGVQDLPQVCSKVTHPLPSQSNKVLQKWNRAFGERTLWYQRFTTVFRSDEAIDLNRDTFSSPRIKSQKAA